MWIRNEGTNFATAIDPASSLMMTCSWRPCSRRRWMRRRVEMIELGLHGDGVVGEHQVSDARMVEFTELELVEALWMAIQALDNEADVLRALGGDGAAAFADDAQRQTRQLREFARQHTMHVENHATEA